ncbi:MAG: DUF3299 domain-containing protein [Betaproteobacteria bacterium]|nr:DUF3299 domain-containing protein [Betaproteobacteria bacterium]
MAHSGTIRFSAVAVVAAITACGAMALQPQDRAKSPEQGGFWIGTDPTPVGTVPWQLLQSTKTVQKADKKFGPVFAKEVRELDKQQVKLYGFMMPLDQARKQKRFLLSAFPPHCSFCLTGGPESLVEVLADTPIDFTFEPVVIAGRLSVLDNDVVYYRLTNATPFKP